MTLWKIEATINDMEKMVAIEVWVFVRAEREYQAKNRAFRKIKRFYPGKRYQVIIDKTEPIPVEVIL